VQVFFLSFVYICISTGDPGDPIIKMGRVRILLASSTAKTANSSRAPEFTLGFFRG
jgi:hypothetical protein